MGLKSPNFTCRFSFFDSSPMIPPYHTLIYSCSCKGQICWVLVPGGQAPLKLFAIWSVSHVVLLLYRLHLRNKLHYASCHSPFSRTVLEILAEVCWSFKAVHLQSYCSVPNFWPGHSWEFSLAPSYLLLSHGSIVNKSLPLFPAVTENRYQFHAKVLH